MHEKYYEDLDVTDPRRIKAEAENKLNEVPASGTIVRDQELINRLVRGESKLLVKSPKDQAQSVIDNFKEVTGFDMNEFSNQ